MGMNTLPVSLHVGAGCKDILSHLYIMGQEFHALKEKYPMRTEANRRTLQPYLFRDFSRGDARWTAWAYHTTRGVVVCARMVG
jgi:hypothetical protein